MPVIHRKTLAVWPFRANIENLTQRLSYRNDVRRILYDDHDEMVQL